jgi:hypothetical protein
VVDVSAHYDQIDSRASRGYLSMVLVNIGGLSLVTWGFVEFYRRFITSKIGGST